MEIIWLETKYASVVSIIRVPKNWHITCLTSSTVKLTSNYSLNDGVCSSGAYYIAVCIQTNDIIEIKYILIYWYVLSIIKFLL